MICMQIEDSHTFTEFPGILGPPVLVSATDSMVYVDRKADVADGGREDKLCKAATAETLCFKFQIKTFRYVRLRAPVKRSGPYPRVCLIWPYVVTEHEQIVGGDRTPQTHVIAKYSYP